MEKASSDKPKPGFPAVGDAPLADEGTQPNSGKAGLYYEQIEQQTML